jgi:hypothetical protein
MRGLKAMQLSAESANAQPRTCKTVSCGKTTRDGKDFCTDHVDKHPYVNSLINRIGARVEEDDLVKRKGSSAVNMDGITVKEILRDLRQNGTRTEERLTREIQLDKTIIHNYLIRLSREGLISFGRTSRNNISVRLVNHDPATEIDDSEIKSKG